MKVLEIALHVPDADCPCGEAIDLESEQAVIEVHYICPCCGLELAFCTQETLDS